MDVFTLDPTQVRDLSSRLLDTRGRLRVVTARKLEATTPEERLLFGMRHGLYGFPTLELIDVLREDIWGKSEDPLRRVRGGWKGAAGRRWWLNAWNPTIIPAGDPADVLFVTFLTDNGTAVI